MKIKPLLTFLLIFITTIALSLLCYCAISSFRFAELITLMKLKKAIVS